MFLWLEKVLGVGYGLKSVAPRDFSDRLCVWCLAIKEKEISSYECHSDWGIRLMNIVRKICGRVLINRLRKGTEAVIGEEHCGFRKGRGCINQIFAVRQLWEKFLAKGWEVYFACMVLEKAYDGVDKRALWQMVSIYGVGLGEKLLRALQSLCEDNGMCVRVGGEKNEWFKARLCDVFLIIQRIHR